MLQRAASEFFARESNRQSMITVTRVRLGNKNRTAQVCVSVFPEEREAQAIDFMKRRKGEFSKFLSEKTKLQYLPKVDFVIDEGEKNRQRIDELSRQS
ncbi:ribosome-binding factor A [bacterium]|nr:ribosome-binding factor A [bacterium]